MTLLPAHDAAATLRFGPAHGDRDFELDCRRLELRHRGTPVDLRRQALRVLALLLQHEGRVVPTAELRRQLWGDQRLGWRNSLHQCVRDLRRALSDDARSPRFVATVARSGYRFVGTQCTSQVGVQEHASPGAPRRFVCWRPRPSVAFAAGFVLALLLPASFIIVCSLLGG